MQFSSLLLTTTLGLFGKIASADSQTDICTPTLGTSVDGFHARFFKYIYPDYAREGSDEDYITTNYNRDDRFITEKDGITDVNFYHFYNINSNGPTYGIVNGLNITTSNFTVEYSGWFVPTETGDHTFKIGQTDDGTSIEIYEDNYSLCCGTIVHRTLIQNLQIYDNEHTRQQSVYLEAGVPYPMKIVYFNKDAVAIQSVSFTDPSGNIHNNFEGYAKYYNDVKCMN